MTLFVLAILAIPLMITVVFLVEVMAGIVAIRTIPVPSISGRHVTLLMPAHDEGQIIGAIIDRLAPEIEGWARLLVVADNCIDDTATIALAHGADVVERHNHELRGKGFALAHGREHLRLNPPDIVIVFDADCTSDRASLQALAASASAWDRPCQAIYLIEAAAGAPPLVQLSNFAFMIKNLIRQRGLERLAGQVHLVGTGMAFPWALFDRATLATANIVEDVELGLALGRAGTPPRLVPAAMTWSEPSSTKGTLIQRTRWEGGFLALAGSKALPAIGDALKTLDPRALIAALDLCVPPLTLLALVDGAALALAALLTWALGAPWWPVLMHLATCVAAIILVAIAWAREGRAYIRAATLMRIPLYILWKIPLYLGLAKRGPGEWLRPGR